MPTPTSEILVMVNGEPRRARALGETELHMLASVIGFDKTEYMLRRDAEGSQWARGWDEETAGALRAVDALKDPP